MAVETAERAAGSRPPSPSIERAQNTDELSDLPVENLPASMVSAMGAMQGMMERIIGGGFLLVIGIIMLGFLFDLDIVSNFSGPFSDQLGTVESILGAAITFAVLGILALAGSYAYSVFTNR